MPCYHPIQLQRKNLKRGFMVVPCGRCIGCRLDKRCSWAIRCMNESTFHDCNTFITLTYRESELPHGFSGPTLVPTDLQLFFKRLRKEMGNGIKYFACGEYGERTHRPHYHACLFGCDFQDKTVDSITEAGYTLYHSDLLDGIWSYGRCIIADFSFDTASYVAGYMTSKKEGPLQKFDDDLGISREFVRMSRRPGLGAKWLDKYQTDIWPHGKMLINGITVRPPRYYLDRFAKANPLEAEIQSGRRQLASEEKYWKDYDKGSPKLSTRERVKKRQINDLTRDSI